MLKVTGNSNYIYVYIYKISPKTLQKFNCLSIQNFSRDLKIFSAIKIVQSARAVSLPNGFHHMLIVALKVACSCGGK